MSGTTTEFLVGVDGRWTRFSCQPMGVVPVHEFVLVLLDNDLQNETLSVGKLYEES